MLDDDKNSTDDRNGTTGQQPAVTRTRRRAAGRPAGPPAALSTDIFSPPAAEPAQRRRAPRKADDAPADPAQAEQAAPAQAETPAAEPTAEASGDAPAAPARRSRARKAPARRAADDAPTEDAPAEDAATETPAADDAPEDIEAEEQAPPAPRRRAAAPTAVDSLFKAPETVTLPPRPRPERDEDDEPTGSSDEDDETTDDGSGEGGPKRRRRSRGGRRRNKGDDAASGEGDQGQKQDSGDAGSPDDDTEDDGQGGTRRRRRRARAGESASGSPDDPENTVVKVREGRSPEDEITGVAGSTRLEAKKQRRREGREAGRRRAPIVSEAEFLARRESVEREMVVRQHDEYTQIAVLEDSVLVEHYVARESQTSLIGNVYLGKVQNVLPSMEAAFVDIGAGRNAVIYAGEVDWSGVQNGKARKIEEALSPGQTVLVQVTKDPVGQKGARLTSQVSLPGRFLVYVPGGQSNGISRKLPDTERARLKTLLKEVLPEEAGVIVRTAAEGASEDQLTRDVSALTARWEDIEAKAAQGKAPQLLYAEPDLVIKVVRDLFNEDFASLVVEGTDAWDNISGYVQHVAPDLAERLREWRPSEHDDQHAFEALRIDEQIHKALERKVWLPSGGSLVIDRTEAMTVVDVNTGKFTGSGGNLEETVTKNNLEAAEEIVRQLRLRDIGGIIVIDFIDMVLESNRDLVLRRLVECLGRDRTRHQVAEVTSLGLVQMTRKRIGTGLLESFSTDCDHCNGRGVVITAEPVEPRKDEPRRGRRGGGRGGNGESGGGGNGGGNGNGNGGGNGNGNGGGGSNGTGSGKGRGSRGGRRGGGQDTSSDEPTTDEAPTDRATEQPTDATAPAGATADGQDGAPQAAPVDEAKVEAPEVEQARAEEAVQEAPAPEDPSDVTTAKADDRDADESPDAGTDPVLTETGDAP